MTIHTCPTCGKEFNKKSTFNYHITMKKYSCRTINDDNIDSIKAPPYNAKTPPYNAKTPPYNANILPKKEEFKNKIDNIENEIKCLYCNKIFTRKDSLTKHFTRCKVIKSIDNTEKIQKLIEELKKRDEEIKFYKDEVKFNREQILSLIQNQNKLFENITSKGSSKNNKNNSENTTNSNNNLTNSHNTVNNINIIQFGKEDLSKISDSSFIKAIRELGINIPVKMLEQIHQNDEHPEYKNVYISDINRGHMRIYDGEKWKLENYDNVKDDLLEKSINFIENRYDELKENNKINKDNKRLIDMHLFNVRRMEEFDEDELDKEGNPLSNYEKTRRKELRVGAQDAIKKSFYNNREKICKENKENK